MSAANRAALISKLHKVAKSHYQPVSPPSDRPLLEHLLYSCCLEDAPFDKADEAFARLQQFYFDWNEVRVTTVAELSETMSALPAAATAASRLKQVLQSVFETHYAFDLEFLKKENIGKAVKVLEKYKGITPFAVGYVTQVALSGHSIPIDRGLLQVMQVLGIITEPEAAKGRIPGMERAIPKTKGIEFGSLVHQLAADYLASPFSKKLRDILQEIAPDAKQRLPKRTKKKAEEPAPATDTKADGKSRNGQKEKTKRSKSKRAAASKGKAAKSQSSSAESKSRSPRGGSNSGKKKSATKRLARKKPR